MMETRNGTFPGKPAKKNMAGILLPAYERKDVKEGKQGQ